MPSPDRKALPFTQVQINDGFWAPRQAANRERGLGAVYRQLEETGRLAAYDLDDKARPHIFWDSDVAKWLEGACASLMTHPDPALQEKVEGVVDRVLSAQQPDGYLNPYFTVVEPQAHFVNLRDKHELYCAGHLLEAAIAHHTLTGDPRFLEGMQRYIALIAQTFGPNEGQRRGYPGHEELELALVKLYRHTGEDAPLALAQYFVEARGRQPHYFDLEAQRRGEDPATYWAKTHAYTQSHRPVREQTEVVGHAVRGMYLYSAMADLAAETDDPSLTAALKTLWADLEAHKLYLTGGIGSSGSNEGFTAPYDLPNEQAYAETCAAIGLVFWSHRMLQLDLDSRYADVLERTLYNGLLSGVSLSGDRFFYENPLASEGAHHRQPFYACSCCPPNINRLLPTIGSYIYSIGEHEIAAHLYIQSQARLTLDSLGVTLTQQTGYPWDGVVCLSVEPDRPVRFALKLRLPGWCRERRVYLNGDPVDLLACSQKGYCVLDREWQPGDVVRLQWLMPVIRVYAHPNVQANEGRVALTRGPLVYCLEAADQATAPRLLRLPRQTTFDAYFDPNLPDGIIVVRGRAQAIDVENWGTTLYRQDPPRTSMVPFRAIPYYAWDNREPGEMRVWLPEAPGEE